MYSVCCVLSLCVMCVVPVCDVWMVFTIIGCHNACECVVVMCEGGAYFVCGVKVGLLCDNVSVWCKSSVQDCFCFFTMYYPASMVKIVKMLYVCEMQTFLML